MKNKISVVTPVYGCCESLNNLYERLERTLSSITDDFEIIMVNDASPDNAWETIKKLAQKDNRVKGINLSKNFGQHYAITAGLDYAQGDWVVVMDCDLQDQPEEIARLYKASQEGYDIVVGIRSERKDSFLKRTASKLFYSIFNYLTDSKVDHRTCNFGIYSRKVIDNIRKLREQNRSFGLFVEWVGFKKKGINVEHAERQSGRSSYTISKMFKLAFDSIIAYSNKMLLLFVKFGFAMSILSFIIGFGYVIKYYIHSVPVLGWTTIIVSMFFLAGIVISVIGTVGLYIGKIFDEVKDRPLYIVESTTFNNNDNLPSA